MTTKDEGGWTGLDTWIMSSDNIICTNQEITVKDKLKCCAYGETTVGAGRAEWDLRIDFESFGGICIGLWCHNLKNKNNLQELPLDEHFAYEPNGYGYTNKTGTLTHDGERKRYGLRYKHGDILTMRLDLMSRELSYKINGKDQGIAYDNLPKGAYRLSIKLQFAEQKVSILRFWTSLGKGKTIPDIPSQKKSNNNNNNESKVADETPKVKPKPKPKPKPAPKANIEQPKPKPKPKPKAKPEEPLPEINYDDYDAAIAEVQAYINDQDNNKTNNDDNNNSNDNNNDTIDDDEATELKALENTKPQNKKGKTASLEDVQHEIFKKQIHELESSNSDNDDDNNNNDNNKKKDKKGNNDISVDIIGGRGRSKSRHIGGSDIVANTKPPEVVIVESKNNDNEMSDFFNKSGSNIKTESDIVTCIRNVNNNSMQSAFGVQIINNGKIEWKIKILKGNSIRIGVCGVTDIGDEIFTNNKYGYGYGDDGNLYFCGNQIDYGDGYKQNDIVSVLLDMDKKTLRFMVNEQDLGEAIENIKVEPDKDVNGYSLAVSLKHRPHQIKLISTKYTSTQRMSPRPNNINNITNNNNKFKFSDKNNNNNNNTNNIKTNNNSEIKDDIKEIESKEEKVSDTISSTKTKKNANKKKKGKDKPKKSGKKTKNDNTKTKKKKDATLKASKSKNDVSINWLKRAKVSDKWNTCGSKMTIDKKTLLANNSLKNGNTAIGTLTFQKNVKIKWEILINQGDGISIGIIALVGDINSAKNRKILNSFFGNNVSGYAYIGKDGGIMRSGRYKKYGEKFKKGDIIGVRLNCKKNTLSFTINGNDQGIAYKNLPTAQYRLAVSLPSKWHKCTLKSISVWDC